MSFKTLPSVKEDNTIGDKVTQPLSPSVSPEPIRDTKDERGVTDISKHTVMSPACDTAGTKAVKSSHSKRHTVRVSVGTFEVISTIAKTHEWSLRQTMDHIVTEFSRNHTR